MSARAISHAVNFRTTVILAADIAAAAVAFTMAFALRLDITAAAHLLIDAPRLVALVSLTSAASFIALRTYRRSWRFTSAPDVAALGVASAVGIAAFVLLLWLVGQESLLPRSVPLIQWPLELMLLCGLRLTRRIVSDYLRGALFPPKPVRPPMVHAQPTLLLGSLERVEMVLRRADRHALADLRPVGLLLDGRSTPLRVRGVPVLGRWADLKRVVHELEAHAPRPTCLLCVEPLARIQRASMAPILEEAQALGLEVAYLPEPAQLTARTSEPLDVRLLDLTELLNRPQAHLPGDMIDEVIRGRRVLVTGAGGSIGRELCRQISDFGPGELLLLESSEFNLYETELELRERHPKAVLVPLLCCIRQRTQLMQLFRQHRPELVFHAAALKHVPLVEKHASAGVLTNVVGTRNVADAARRYGAIAMVQVSSDKAVNPVGHMGVTKRLGELYCQALDLAGEDTPGAPRFMTVRFGNVLGSSGSLIPLFQRQLSRGGPLTVTHPEIERFFMTIHEAVQLILHAAAGGLRGGAKRGRIFVLDMGEPIRVIDIAHRMIELAGLRPNADIKIDIVGLRPGEKLYEELFDTCEERLPSSLPGILEAVSYPLPMPVLSDGVRAMHRAAAQGDDDLCRRLAADLLAAQTAPPVPPAAEEAERSPAPAPLPIVG